MNKNKRKGAEVSSGGKANISTVKLVLNVGACTDCPDHNSMRPFKGVLVDGELIVQSIHCMVASRSGHGAQVKPMFNIADWHECPRQQKGK